MLGTLVLCLPATQRSFASHQDVGKAEECVSAPRLNVTAATQPSHFSGLRGQFPLHRQEGLWGWRTRPSAWGVILPPGHIRGSQVPGTLARMHANLLRGWNSFSGSFLFVVFFRLPPCGRCLCLYPQSRRRERQSISCPVKRVTPASAGEMHSPHRGLPA